MNSQVDDAGFFAFANFLKTGEYVHPFGTPYPRVHTGSPPLYSVLLAAVSYIPRADIVLHVLQVFMLVGMAWFLYMCIKDHFGRDVALIGACFLIWIPGNVVFATYALSDLGAEFLFTIYCYCIYMFIKSKNPLYLSFSVLFGFITGLQRFSFLVFGVISFCVLMYTMPKKIYAYVPAFLGLCVIGGWVFYQHSLTGVWGVSNTVGIRYNAIMMMVAKELPDEDHPSMIEIRKYIPKDVDLRRPFWELEPYLLPHIGYDFEEMDRLVGNVGKAAAWEHPDTFLLAATKVFFLSHIGAPHTRNVGRYLRDQTDEYPRQFCNEMMGVVRCRPLIMTNHSFSIWDAYIDVSHMFYMYLFPFWSFFIFFPLTVWSVFSSNIYLRIYTILFFVGRIPIAMATWLDPRYLLPFYPLMILVTLVGSYDVYQRLCIKK